MAKSNRKGRSKGDGRFVRLGYAILESEAWKYLTPAERSVYLNIRFLYSGFNNGSIGLGSRAAAKWSNINKDTAARCLKRLLEVGLIERTRPAGFSCKVRLAPEWRLTDIKCDLTNQLPSRAYQSWRPPLEKSTVSK
jgi:hypothetical protein